jgi:hypothetical protein
MEISGNSAEKNVKNTFMTIVHLFRRLPLLCDRA